MPKELVRILFQERFPNSRTIEDLAFFAALNMGTKPSVTFKMEKWNSAIGSTGAIQSAWFRIRGIPYEKRSFSNASKVGSFVGLPLEVDTVNLHKFEYVRVKIGCRDITKVPVVVNGLLDFFFYDFKFQREVVQEGTTSPAGNKWLRNDKPCVDKPSPKKQKLGEGQNKTGIAQNSQQRMPKSTNVGKGVQLSATEKGKSLVEDVESEDEGLKFGDFLSPGGSSINFGSFQQEDVQKIWKMQLNENLSTVINEYGTNLSKSKFDSLAAIEAKFAMKTGKEKVVLEGVVCVRPGTTGLYT